MYAENTAVVDGSITSDDDTTLDLSRTMVRTRDMRPNDNAEEAENDTRTAGGTSDEQSGGSDDEEEYVSGAVAAMRRGIAEALEPLRTLLQGLAREWRETILREIHTFFAAPVKPAVVEVVAYEAVVEER